MVLYLFLGSADSQHNSQSPVSTDWYKMFCCFFWAQFTPMLLNTNPIYGSANLASSSRWESVLTTVKHTQKPFEAVMNTL